MDGCLVIMYRYYNGLLVLRYLIAANVGVVILSLWFGCCVLRMLALIRVVLVY